MPVCLVCGRTKIRSRDSQAFSCTQTTLPGTSFPKTGQSPRITFLSILPCTCGSVNAKQNCRPCACTHLHTFTVSIVCSSLSLSCRVRTQPASLMHGAQFLFLQAVRETVSNHSPQTAPLFTIPHLPFSFHNNLSGAGIPRCCVT